MCLAVKSKYSFSESHFATTLLIAASSFDLLLQGFLLFILFRAFTLTYSPDFKLTKNENRNIFFVIQFVILIVKCFFIGVFVLS